MTYLDLRNAPRDDRGRLIVTPAKDDADDMEALIADSARQIGGANTVAVATVDDPQSTAVDWGAWIRHQLDAPTIAIFSLTLLVLALAFLAFRPADTPALRRLAAPTAAPAPTQAPTMAPTPALQDAYASPGGALLGSIPLTTTIAYQHSAHKGWGGIVWQGGVVWVQTDAAQLAHLPDLAPLPTAAPPPTSAPPPPAAAPDRGCDPTVNPIYAVEHDVTGPHGEPLGHVRGVSCDSQAEAQANADVLADGVLSNVATADAATAPTATPDRSRQ